MTRVKRSEISGGVVMLSEDIFSRFHSMRADYDAAKASQFVRRREGLIPLGSSADYHYRDDYSFHNLREQARDMDRNDVLVGMMVDRSVANEVQQGFTLKPSTGDKGLDTALKMKFEEWSEDEERSDLACEHPFSELVPMLSRQQKIDGDVFVLLTDTGKLQVVEAHRCRTPQRTKRNVIHGILVDQDTRERLEYWFSKDDIDPLRPVHLVSEVERYPKRDQAGYRQVLHLYDPRRATQTRGITCLAPVAQLCGMHEDTQFAQMVRQQICSCFVIFRKRTAEWRGGESSKLGSETTRTLDDGQSRTIEGLGPGLELKTDVGEELEGFSPDIPSPQFFEHIRHIQMLISSRLGIPLVAALMDASETNFSGFRGAIEEAKKGWRANQNDTIRQLCRPVYRWKVRRWIDPDTNEYDPAIARAAKRSEVRIFNHVWRRPGWPYLEPLTDASADLLQMRNGLSSRSRIHASRDLDADELEDEIITDNVRAIRKAKKAAAALNAEFDDGDPISWQQVMSLPTPDGMTVNVSSMTQPNQQPTAMNRAPKERPSEA